MPTTKRILLTEKQAIIRHGLSKVINEIFPNVLILEADDIDIGYKIIVEENIDLLIMDINTSDGNLLQTIEVMKLKRPQTKILIFSQYEERLYAIPCFKAKVDGYLLKTSPIDEIKKAINLIFANEKYISSTAKQILLQSLGGGKNKNSNPLHSLSLRELEIMNFLLQGSTISHISRNMHIQVSTVSTYKNRIFEKMGVNNIISLSEVVKLNIDEAYQGVGKAD